MIGEDGLLVELLFMCGEAKKKEEVEGEGKGEGEGEGEGEGGKGHTVAGVVPS